MSVYLGYSPAALAGKSNDTLVFASDLEVENVAPYYNNLREGIILKRHVWDTLLYRDPVSGKFQPMLATSWRWVTSTTLEFTIRDGVHFHNGDPFSVDDVVFTFNYVLSPASKIVTKPDVDWMKSAEKVDDHTVRITLKAPYPAALSYIAGAMQILPQKYLTSVGIDAFAKKPIGTGPYKITEITSSLAVKMERNEGYWAGSPLGRPAIKYLEFRPIADSETRTAELLSGGVDWIWRVPADQASYLEDKPGVQILSSETMRTGSLLFDSLGRSDPKSPMKDKRVRQAIAYAIDRKAMVENIVRGKSEVLNAFCFPAQFGCQQDVPRYELNIAKAKALLAEAGYPDGFDTEIWTYGDRDYVEAIIGYLRAVGIRAKLVFSQYPPLRDAVWKGRVPILYLSWGSSSIYDVSAITSYYFSGSDDDMTKDPEVMSALRAGDVALDDAERKIDYQKGLSRIADQAFALPLFSYSMNYAFTSDLIFPAYPDEIPRFFEAKWK